MTMGEENTDTGTGTQSIPRKGNSLNSSYLKGSDPWNESTGLYRNEVLV